MAEYKVVNADLLDNALGTIADAIREQTGRAEQIPFPNGFASAPDELVEVGRQKEYDEWWDIYQQNGNRTDYAYAFAGIGWTDAIFKPSYPIVPTLSRRIFHNTALTLDESFNNYLDFSKSTDFYDAFRGWTGTTLGLTVDLSSANDIGTMFSGCRVVTIKRIVFSESIVGANSVFNQCTALANLGAEGIIAVTLSFQWCPLTAESAKSVINCLKNYAGTSEANTKKITFSATTWGYLDAEGEASPDGTTWRDYIYDLGWNT